MRKVARTIADLAGRESIASEDVAEGLQFRLLGAISVQQTSRGG
jgi:predicted ATPase with chaperone activity